MVFFIPVEWQGKTKFPSHFYFPLWDGCETTVEIQEKAKVIQQTTKERQQATGEMLDKARTHQEIGQQIQQMSYQNAERHAKLLDKWEEQAQRFDEILTKWEQMQ